MEAHVSYIVHIWRASIFFVLEPSERALTSLSARNLAQMALMALQAARAKLFDYRANTFKGNVLIIGRIHLRVMYRFRSLNSIVKWFRKKKRSAKS